MIKNLEFKNLKMMQFKPIPEGQSMNKDFTIEYKLKWEKDSFLMSNLLETIHSGRKSRKSD